MYSRFLIFPMYNSCFFYLCLASVWRCLILSFFWLWRMNGKIYFSAYRSSILCPSQWVGWAAVSVYICVARARGVWSLHDVSHSRLIHLPVTHHYLRSPHQVHLIHISSLLSTIWMRTLLASLTISGRSDWTRVNSSLPSQVRCSHCLAGGDSSTELGISSESVAWCP